MDKNPQAMFTRNHNDHEQWLLSLFGARIVLSDIKARRHLLNKSGLRVDGAIAERWFRWTPTNLEFASQVGFGSC